MTIRTVLVPLDGSELSGKALVAALRLARGLTAHVTALHVRTDPRDTVPLLGEGLSASMIEELMAASERESDRMAVRAREAFDSATHMEEVPSVDPSPAPGEVSATWLEDMGRVEGAVIRAGRLHDLMVLPRPEPDHGYGEDGVLNAAVFETGRPVLFVPPNTAPAPGQHVAVAWNGSRESVRAVQAALPLMKRAETVHVFTVEDGDVSAQAAAELAEHLEWHGVDPVLHTVDPAGRLIGEALLEDVREADCDLLVMGAYGHSRMRELILGGVTRYVLGHADRAVLMAH